MANYSAYHSFTRTDVRQLCDGLAVHGIDFRRIIDTYGYPPFWTRPNSFESLVHIILEQQVSLASARAALEKLRAAIGTITPERVLALSDEEMKATYFSRQKASYVRHLGQQLIDKQLVLQSLEAASDQTVRDTLIQLKGVGNWTVDIYLLFVLHRSDVFPTGDIAAMNALKQLKSLAKQTTTEELIAIAEPWRPYRSIATMLLWHYYLSSRGRSA